MRSTSLRVSIAMSAALLALASLEPNVLAQSVTINVDSPFSPIPVGTGQTVANVSTTNTPPTPPYTCTLSGPTWQWTINNEPDGVTISPNGSSATVNAQNISSSGEYMITVSAYASWTDSCGGSYPDAASNDTVLDLVVVAVTGITPKSEVYTTKNIGDTLTKADFDITTDPPGYQDEDFVVVAPVTIQLGDNWVTATCGSSSVETDVMGGKISGSLSDLIVGPDYSDDSMNLTALVQGVDGEYSVSGGDVDGGDTSGDLIKDQAHSGTVYISATPPSDSSMSRLPIFLNGILVYGLGGIPGSTDVQQVNGEPVTIILGVSALVIAVGAAYTAYYATTLDWINPVVYKAGNVPISIQVVVNPQMWNTTVASTTFQMIPGGRARVSMYGYKYTEGAAETLNTATPSPTTVTYTDNNGKEFIYSVCTYAQANLAGQPGMSDQNEQAGSSASDSAFQQKSQIQTGTGQAGMWVGTAKPAFIINTWLNVTTGDTVTWGME